MRTIGMPTARLNGFESAEGRGTRAASKITDSQGALAEYERLLRQLHPNFCKKLLNRAPTITPMELKVCMLTRAFLGIKESASLLSVSESSIESHRWHARRKLGIEGRDQNLMSVLHAI